MHLKWLWNPGYDCFFLQEKALRYQSTCSVSYRVLHHGIFTNNYRSYCFGKVIFCITWRCFWQNNGIEISNTMRIVCDFGLGKSHHKLYILFRLTIFRYSFSSHNRGGLMQTKQYDKNCILLFWVQEDTQICINPSQVT